MKSRSGKKPCAGNCGALTYNTRKYCVKCSPKFDALAKQSAQIRRSLPWYLIPDTSTMAIGSYRPFYDDAMTVGLAIREKATQVSL